MVTVPVGATDVNVIEKRNSDATYFGQPVCYISIAIYIT